jgi:hypothetical protein
MLQACRSFTVVTLFAEKLMVEEESITANQLTACSSASKATSSGGDKPSNKSSNSDAMPFAPFLCDQPSHPQR